MEIAKHIKILSKGLEPVKLVQTRPVSSEEKLLLVAIQEPRIAADGLDNLKTVLRYCIMKVGLRAANWPSDEEKALLISHILNNYSNHTAQEIRLAFDMAIEGKLGVDANCYENFSCLYFSGIMNAYRIWSAQAYRQTLTNTVEQTVYTEEQLLDQKRGWCEEAYQRMLAGTQNVVPASMKEVLVKDGFVKDESEIVEFLVYSLGTGVKNLYTK